ncbi:quinone oxidoreductase family protein [Rhodoplanes roseus]|uniref:Alcohol dehydrogenase n=1 Tax=Rhodoplanes roseus TaxID=29409 RepID=A0A327L197_9BRAD|nr:quinone oxidoreductase [Rhodoplanes roseus]RAI44034.1 alcohol dehydrogenase [Rhodoplanes roseus]
MPLTIQMSETGGPEVLRPVERAAAEPGPGEARIRHEAIGLNFIDVYQRRGLYPVPLPAVLGVEGAGIVEAVGSGVTDLAVGQRVVYGGLPVGAYAAVRTLPASRLVALPDAVSTPLAASAFLRGLTAHMLFHEVKAVRPGDAVLVHAGAGGLGRVLLRWGHRLGAAMIATVGSAAKVAAAREAGADHVVLHTDADWPDQVRRLAGGRGVTLACDGIGGATLARTLECVRPFGVVASLGQPAGPIPPVPVEALGPARSIGLFRPSVIAYSNDPDRYATGAADVLAFLADRPSDPVGATYPLAEAARAHADLEAGRTTGSIVLVP